MIKRNFYLSEPFLLAIWYQQINTLNWFSIELLEAKIHKAETMNSWVPSITPFNCAFLHYRQWRSLDEAEKKYLIQIMPPADIIPEIIRSIVLYQKITNAGILFDDSVGKTVS